MNNTFTFTIKRWKAGVVCFALFALINILANIAILKMSPFVEYPFIIMCVFALILCGASFLLYNALKNTFAEFTLPKFYKQCSFVFNILWAVLLCVSFVLLLNIEAFLPLIGNSIGSIIAFAFKLLFAFTFIRWAFAMLTPHKTRLTALQSVLLPAVQLSATAGYICLLGYDQYLQNTFIYMIAPVLIALMLLLLIFFANAIFTKRKVTQ